MGINRINELIKAVEDHYDADIYLISTLITDFIADNVNYWINDINKVHLHKNIILILRTYGGFSDAAYKIARAFQTAYKTCDKSKNEQKNEKDPIFYLFVNGICKSAGTLIATGADIYILTDKAEFGPIDAQIRKPDEAGERTSGLVTTEAFEPLRKQALETFCGIFDHLRHDNNFGLSSKFAAEIANNLTIGLLSPVYAQIDPLRVAELDRVLKIGAGYAERLSHGNLRDGAIGMLLASYPSHSFVIDKEEAEKKLFKRVESPIAALESLGHFCSMDENGFGPFYPLKIMDNNSSGGNVDDSENAERDCASQTQE